MKYIVKLFENYYLRHDKGSKTWIETYNPNCAKTFESKKEAERWVTKNTHLEDFFEIVSLNEEVLDFMSWVDNGMTRREFKLLDKSFSRPYNGEDKYKVLAWRIKAEDDSFNVRYEDYRTWPELYSVFNHLRSVVSYDLKHDGSPYVMTFSMSVEKGSTSFETFKEELELIIPYVTFKDEEGNLVIDIFDHKLSAHGDSVSILVKLDGSFSLVGRHPYFDEIKSGSLEDIFKYIAKYRWY